MKISKIEISPIKSSFFEPVVTFFIAIIGFLFLLLVVPFILIAEKLFPKKFTSSESVLDKNLFFENEKFKIWEQYPDYETLKKDFLPLYKWFTNMIGEYSTDHLVIRKLYDNQGNTELNQHFYTYFSMQNKQSVFLQKLVLENDKVNSFLISFDKTTGKTETITEVGDFILLSFDEKKRAILGSNWENDIHIFLDEENVYFT